MINIQNFLQKTVPTPQQEFHPSRPLHLYDLVNVTDFIEFNEFLQLFQVDNFTMCMKALVQERELNYSFNER
jgi:hypothetical protein